MGVAESHDVSRPPSKTITSSGDIFLCFVLF
jgi:hypothetical protein